MGSKKPDILVEDKAVYLLRAGVPVFVKTADICAITDTSKQWVSELVSRGVLYKQSTAHGAMFDLREAMRSYCAMLKTRAEPEKTPDELERESAKEAAEVKLKVAKATMAELEAAELQGKMHRSEDVAAMTQDLIFAVRGMLIALPGRLAVDVAGAESAAEAAEIIRREVNLVMAELTRHRYDPKKYDELVRERKSWEESFGNEEQL